MKKFPKRITIMILAIVSGICLASFSKSLLYSKDCPECRRFLQTWRNRTISDATQEFGVPSLVQPDNASMEQGAQRLVGGVMVQDYSWVKQKVFLRVRCSDNLILVASHSDHVHFPDWLAWF